MILRLFVFLFLTFSYSSCFSQERSACHDIFWSTSKSKPSFGNQRSSLEDYLLKNLPALPSTGNRGIFKVKMNCKGEIFYCEKIFGSIEESVQQGVIQTLLAMPQWAPARRESSIDYQFYIEIKTIAANKLMINLTMQ